MTAIHRTVSHGDWGRPSAAVLPGACVMDTVLEFVLSVLGEAVFSALAPVLLALVWAAGAFCLLYGRAGGATAGWAAVAAFACGLALTFLWSEGSRRARNLLLGGALVALVPVALALWNAPSP